MKKGRASNPIILFVGLCTLSFVAVLSADRYVISYLPFGGGWSSRILFVNPTDQATNVELLFFSGDDASLASDEESTSGSRQILLQPGATQSVEVGAEQGESARVGWAVARSDTPVQVFSTFNFSLFEAVETPKESQTDGSQAGGLAVSQGGSELSTAGQRQRVGPPIAPPGRPDDRPPTGPPPPGPPEGRPPVSVPVTTPAVSARVSNISGMAVLPSGTGFMFPVTVFGSRNFNAFMAIANPNNVDANVSLELAYSDGLQKLNRVVQLPSRGQLTSLLTDESLFDLLSDSSTEFDGTVTVCSDVPIGVIAVGTAGEMAYTLPVTISNRCSGVR